MTLPILRPDVTVNDFDEQTKANRYKKWGTWVTRPFRQKIHASNGMQMTEPNETPKMKCNKRDFYLWRRDEQTDSNIGSNGDGSSLEVPRTMDLWKADSSFIHWAMESTIWQINTRMLTDWLNENSTETNSTLKLKWLKKPTQTKTEILLQNYSLHFGPQTEEKITVHTCDETERNGMYNDNV